MHLETIEKRYKEQEAKLLSKQGPELPPLWNHQKEAINRAEKLNYFALFFDVGTGKSRTLVEMVESKYAKHNGILKTLILCPLIVVENLKREFEKFGRKSKGHIVPLVGPNKKRMRVFQENLTTSKIFITNYEALYNQDLVQVFRLWRPEIFVADEIHRLKDTQAKRTKVAIDLADMAKYKYGLSGTPILNTQLDLFSQVRILDGGHTFGKNPFIFRAQYFYNANAHRAGTSGYFPMWLPRPGIDKDLKEKIAPFSMAVKKSECLDLPPLLFKEVEVEMGEEQARLYKQMKKDFIAFIKDKACVAELAITKALRLQQIVSGFIKLEDETEVSFDKVPRLEALEQLVCDIAPTNKVIIWATFRKNYEMIAQILNSNKISYAILTGDIINKQVEIDKFQLDDSVRVMLANPSAGGIGINLTAASYMIYYSRSFNLEHEIQSEARCYRAGSEMHSKITRIDIINRDSIDDIISKTLAKKKEMGDNILSNSDIIGILKREL